MNRFNRTEIEEHITAMWDKVRSYAGPDAEEAKTIAEAAEAAEARLRARLLAQDRLDEAAPALLDVARRLLRCRAGNGDGTWSTCAPNAEDFEAAESAVAVAEGRDR